MFISSHLRNGSTNLDKSWGVQNSIPVNIGFFYQFTNKAENVVIGIAYSPVTLSSVVQDHQYENQS